MQNFGKPRSHFGRLGHSAERLISMRKAGCETGPGLWSGSAGLVRRQSPLEDWRGFIGDLEREVKPWMDPSLGRIAKARSQEVMPWFRLMTLVNPHRVRGYRVGTGMIMMEGTPEALDRAWEFANRSSRRVGGRHPLPRESSPRPAASGIAEAEARRRLRSGRAALAADRRETSPESSRMSLS